MFKDKTMVGGILLLLVGVGIAIALWVFLLQTPQEASQPISSEPIASNLTGSGVDATAGFVTFGIVPAASQASFSLGELLRGEPQMVVGSTDQIAGQLIVGVSLSVTVIEKVQLELLPAASVAVHTTLVVPFGKL